MQMDLTFAGEFEAGDQRARDGAAQACIPVGQPGRQGRHEAEQVTAGGVLAEDGVHAKDRLAGRPLEDPARRPIPFGRRRVEQAKHTKAAIRSSGLSCSQFRISVLLRL